MICHACPYQPTTGLNTGLSNEQELRYWATRTSSAGWRPHRSSTQLRTCPCTFCFAMLGNAWRGLSSCTICLSMLALCLCCCSGWCMAEHIHNQGSNKHPVQLVHLLRKAATPALQSTPYIYIIRCPRPLLLALHAAVWGLCKCYSHLLWLQNDLWLAAAVHLERVAANMACGDYP